MRVCLLFVAVAIGWLSASGDARAATQIYLLKGLVNVFSGGMDTLADKLKKRGYSATVHGNGEYETLATEAAKLKKRGNVQIVIIGHSLGADAAVSMAEKMKDAGATVDLIVTFGPTHDLEVPSNVRRIVNYHQASSLWRGTISKGPGFKGSLTNINLDKDDDVTHFNIEKIDRLHRQTIVKIQAIAKPGRVNSGSGKP